MTNYSPYCRKCGGCGEDGCCSAAACTQRGGDYCDTYLRDLKLGYVMNRWFQENVYPHIDQELKQLYDTKWNDSYDILNK